jgi:hypothetical protein
MSWLHTATCADTAGKLLRNKPTTTTLHTPATAADLLL